MPLPQVSDRLSQLLGIHVIGGEIFRGPVAQGGNQFAGIAYGTAQRLD